MPAGTNIDEGGWVGIPTIYLTNLDDYKKLEKQQQAEGAIEFYDGKSRGYVYHGVMVAILTSTYPV